MADKKEKDLTKVSDAAYIRALDSNGNPVLISKADLAQVAAELMPVATITNNGLMGKAEVMQLYDNGNKNHDVFMRVLTIPEYKRACVLLAWGINTGTVYNTALLYFNNRGKNYLLTSKLRLAGSDKIYYRHDEDNTAYVYVKLPMNEWTSTEQRMLLNSPDVNPAFAVADVSEGELTSIDV